MCMAIQIGLADGGISVLRTHRLISYCWYYELQIYICRNISLSSPYDTLEKSAGF